MIEKLAFFEKIADEKVANLAIWRCPVQWIISVLNNAIYSLYFDEGQNRLENRYKAEKMVGFLSGVAPQIAGGNDKLIKISAIDFADSLEKMKEDVKSIIEYGQLCTFMDRYHKGEFCEETHNGHTRLTFGGAEQFTHEAQDVVISELSLPYFSDQKHSLDPEFTLALALGREFFLSPRVLEQIKAQMLSIAKADGDIEYVGDFSDVVPGIGSDDYKSLKLSAIALGFYCRSVARFLEEAISRGLVKGDRPASRLIFWKSPCLKKCEVVSLLSRASSVEAQKAEAFVETFCLKIGADCPAWIKTGYFPPFQELGDRLLFCPVLVMTMINNRNALYICSKNNKKTFDNIVSSRMEPKLVDDFVVACEGLKGCIFEKSVKFTGGEIDLVCWNAKENLVLQVQAKGSIAPEGAVLVRNFEDRCREGIAQLRKFENLGQAAMVEELQRRIPGVQPNVRIVSAILARGSFGRPKFLIESKGILFLNPLFGNMMSAGQFDWSDPIAWAEQTIANILKEIECVSKYENMPVFGEVIEVESAVWDRSKLAKVKVAIASKAVSAPRNRFGAGRVAYVKASP